MNEQEIAIERIGADTWRVHSYYSKDSIALSAQGMRELLDLLLQRAREFERSPGAPGEPDKSLADWRAIEAQAKIDLERIATDRDAYAFIERYLAKGVRGQLVAIYKSIRQEMCRTPRQAIDELLSLPPFSL